MNFLNKIYSNFKERLNFISLGSFPTSVQHIDGMEKEFGRAGLFIKRDDLSGKIYGGNKVRKLEYILGEVVAKGYKIVLTSGAAGSNHVLAVSAYSSLLGLKPVLMLFAQPFNPSIPQNLLADYFFGATIYYDESWEAHNRSIQRMVEYYKNQDVPVYVIAPGGSSSQGTIGYVNAAYELKWQIDTNQIPDPTAIYLPLGTCGTAAGLILGMKAAGVKSKLKAVSVVPPGIANMEKVGILFESANRILHDSDKAFPVCCLKEDDIEIVDSYVGSGYGITTSESSFASRLFWKTDKIRLDTVYTGKAFAAFIDEIKTGFGNNLLFWNTKNSRPLPSEAFGQDYHQLPPQLYKYFEQVK